MVEQRGGDPDGVCAKSGYRGVDGDVPDLQGIGNREPLFRGDPLGTALRLVPRDEAIVPPELLKYGDADRSPGVKAHDAVDAAPVKWIEIGVTGKAPAGRNDFPGPKEIPQPVKQGTFAHG
jgi:hypothetical protein